MAQCVIDPQSSLVLLLARRVNSAAGERGLRRSAMRNYSAPVVTACSIDPPTAPHQLFDLLLQVALHLGGLLIPPTAVLLPAIQTPLSPDGLRSVGGAGFLLS